MFHARSKFADSVVYSVAQDGAHWQAEERAVRIEHQRAAYSDSTLTLRSNGAILEYLESEGFAQSAAALRSETECDEGDKKGALVKKWTSVIRLQKKVCLRVRTHAQRDAHEGKVMYEC